MKHPKLVTVMRVKNEEDYLDRAISSLLPLGGKIVVLDDGSTDATPEIARAFDSVHYHRQDDLSMDEGRDRTFLQREAFKLKPGWIFTLDGDEELPEITCERMLRAASDCPPDVNVFDMLLAVMWGKNRYFDMNKYIWSMSRMFRVKALKDRKYEFKSNFKSNLHCGCVPKPLGKGLLLNAFIKYWGYESEEKSDKKLAFYKKHDPKNHPNVKRLIEKRITSGKSFWRDDMDARNKGIHNTVSY